jgi:hypothetical protein
VETKLKTLKYESFDSFKKDLHLMVDNCLKFNEKNTEVHSQAMLMRKSINKEVLRMGLVLWFLS